MTNKEYFVVFAVFVLCGCATDHTIEKRRESYYTLDSISPVYFPCIRYMSPECIPGRADREVDFYNRFDVCLPLAKVKMESPHIQTYYFFYPNHQLIGFYAAYKGGKKRFPWTYEDGIYDINANEAESTLSEYTFAEAANKISIRKKRKHRFIARDNVYILLYNIKRDKIEEFTLMVNGTLKVYMGEREKQMINKYRQNGYVVNGEK